MMKLVNTRVQSGTIDRIFDDHQSAADREPVYCSGISQHGRSERRRRRKHSGADQQQSKCNGHVHCGNAEPFYRISPRVYQRSSA